MPPIVIPAKAGIQDLLNFTGFPIKLGMTENRFLIIDLAAQLPMISNSKPVCFVAEVLGEEFEFFADFFGRYRRAFFGNINFLFFFC